MDLSNPPKDILGLGKHLVRELDFENGVDTLGRWMAHHLAELIHESENGKTVAKQTKAKKQATETILKIWDHRKALPREAYPLTKFEDLLNIIDRLRISNNPYRYYSGNFNEIDLIASKLFDNFARLIPSLLFMKREFLESQKTVNNVAIEALDKEEAQIWMGLQEWMVIFPEESKRNEISNKRKKKKKFDLKKNSLDLIGNIRNLLDEISKELNK